MTPVLPPEVIDQDRRLQKSTDQLMQLRWHWTINPDNPDGHLSHAEYARQVGTDRKRISNDANAWADWLADQRAGTSPRPGAPQTPSDYRELRNLSSEKQEAAKAVAQATGASVSNVARNKRADVQAVLDTAREHAVDRGTTVEHEIEKAAEWHAKTQRAAKVEKDRKRANTSALYIEVEGKLGRMLGLGRDILTATEGDPEFADEDRDLLIDTLGKLRALLHLLEVRIARSTDVDWDAELVKLGNGS